MENIDHVVGNMLNVNVPHDVLHDVLHDNIPGFDVLHDTLNRNRHLHDMVNVPHDMVGGVPTTWS